MRISTVYDLTKTRHYNLWIERKDVFQIGYCLYQIKEFSVVFFSNELLFYLLEWAQSPRPWQIHNWRIDPWPFPENTMACQWRAAQWCKGWGTHRRHSCTPCKGNAKHCLCSIEINCIHTFTYNSGLIVYANIEMFSIGYLSRRTWRCMTARIPADCPTFLFRWSWHPPSPLATPDFTTTTFHVFFGNISSNELIDARCDTSHAFSFAHYDCVPVRRRWWARSDKAAAEWWIVGRHPVRKRRCWIHDWPMDRGLAGVVELSADSAQVCWKKDGRHPLPARTPYYFYLGPGWWIHNESHITEPNGTRQQNPIVSMELTISGCPPYITHV